MASAPVSLKQFELRPFVRDLAPLVASWVESDDALFVLAPATQPPLTPQKVLQWTGQQEKPFLLWQDGRTEPVGYAELNCMPRDARDLWIGHVIVPRALRGQGIGFALVEHLLRHAFEVMYARQASLIVFPENEVAIHCYLKSGMRVAGKQTKAFDSRSGQYTMLRMTMTRRQYERKRKLAELSGEWELP